MHIPFKITTDTHTEYYFPVFTLVFTIHNEAPTYSITTNQMHSYKHMKEIVDRVNTNTIHSSLTTIEHISKEEFFSKLGIVMAQLNMIYDASSFMDPVKTL